MDISKLSENLAQCLSNGYYYAVSAFNCRPEDADAEKQRKIRRYVEKNYIYPAEETGAAELMNGTTSDGEFISVMKACYEFTQQRERENREEFTCTLTAFPADVQAAFRSLNERYMYTQIQQEGDHAAIYVDNCSSFVQKLLLKDATGIPEKQYHELTFDRLQMFEDGFVLSGCGYDLDTDESVPFSICFTDASVEVTCFRAGATDSLFDIPYWKYLCQTADEILRKRNLPEGAMNDEEKELIPLLREIVYISTRVGNDLEDPDLVLFRDWLSRYGYEDLLKQINRILALPADKRQKPIAKLEKALSHKKYEPMCRELMEKIFRSQEPYPEKVSCHCSAELLGDIRDQIIKQLEAQGYKGQYPHFVKHGEIRGIRMVDAFDESYCIGPEKNVIFYVSCREVMLGDELTIRFFSGTHCLRKNETAEDIWSCAFRDGGRRILRTVTFETKNDQCLREEASQELSQIVNIVVKRAELKKLTKEERNLLNGFPVPWGLLYIILFFGAGGLFATLTTLVLMVMGAVATAIFGGFSMIPEILLSIPWWHFFLLTFVLYGGVMSAVTIAAKNK